MGGSWGPTAALVRGQDLERWLDGGDDDADGADGESLPDDNISQYSNGDDDAVDGE